MWPNPINYFAGYIERETGIVYQESNLYQLQIRLEDICRTEGINSLEALASKFQSNDYSAALKQRLLDQATNNETLFFRDPSYFVALESFIQNTLIKENVPEIKIWSAASSTGQEALSVAMTLEDLSQKSQLPPYQIIATDICEKALLKCRAGTYTDFEIMRGLSEERRMKYFNHEADLWRVKPSLHSKIKFGHNNLIRSSVHEKFHIILCRNVLIYQKVDMKKAVIETLFNQLDPLGVVLLGAGETMIGVKENVHSETINNVTFYRKNKLGLPGAA